MSTVKQTLQPWRAAESQAGKGAAPPAVRRAWKQVRWTILCPPERLGTQQREYLEKLLALHPKLALAHGLVQRFRERLRERWPDRLDCWLRDAATSGLAPFEKLARTLAGDKAAVLAAAQLPWSAGPVEGIITRIKLAKRIGYGRAGLSLLRARIVGTF